MRSNIIQIKNRKMKYLGYLMKRQLLENLILTRLTECRMARGNHIAKIYGRIRTMMDDEKQTLFRHKKYREF